MRGIFFDEDDARAVVARLRADGWAAELARERLAGEDDDEDHPWAVVTDAPEFQVDLLVEEFDGWLDAGGQPGARLPQPPELPSSPRRIKRPGQ